MESQILPKEFYLRQDVLQIARDLLGKKLVSRIDGIRTAGIITEVEAYSTPDDKACHAYGNRRTPRTEVMFRSGGCAYIYLCYGIHHLFNVVTGPQNMAQAVLIRAIEPVEGLQTMLNRRGQKKISPQLTTGPGVLSAALGLHKNLSGESLLSKKGKIWIENSPLHIKKEDIACSPRIGVAYAEECAKWPWRFYLKNSKWTKKTKTQSCSAETS